MRFNQSFLVGFLKEANRHGLSDQQAAILYKQAERKGFFTGLGNRLDEGVDYAGNKFNSLLDSGIDSANNTYRKIMQGVDYAGDQINLGRRNTADYIQPKVNDLLDALRGGPANPSPPEHSLRALPTEIPATANRNGIDIRGDGSPYRPLAPMPTPVPAMPLAPMPTPVPAMPSVPVSQTNAYAGKPIFSYNPMPTNSLFRTPTASPASAKNPSVVPANSLGAPTLANKLLPYIPFGTTNSSNTPAVSRASRPPTIRTGKGNRLTVRRQIYA